MTANAQKPREFTGRHMLAIILTFFGVVIAANLTMATLANP
ncbi:cytochrome oxidase, partial [Mesorhizobium sp. M7A.F.Ca.US.002.01.1.1]